MAEGLGLDGRCVRCGEIFTVLADDELPMLLHAAVERMQGAACPKCGAKARDGNVMVADHADGA